MDVRAATLDLTHRLGAPEAGLAILAEGNASGREDDGTFWVKASGRAMHELPPEGLTRVRLDPLVAALDGADLDDDGVRAALDAVRTDPAAGRPSVETFLHAYLLTLPGVRYVAHCHPQTLLGLLCTDRAPVEAGRRYFPDEIVLTGAASPFVPYVDPGLPLARAVRTAVEGFGETPKTIWLGNHGLLALGATLGEAWGATEMTEKAARLRAAFPDARPLGPESVARIAGRPDEHHRQRMLFNPAA